MSLFPSNIRSETKAKFDSLLKSALRRNPTTKSKEQLVDTHSDEDAKAEVNEDFEMESYEGEEDKKYIMDKFLKDANQGGKFKAPIPKPRKNISQENSGSSSGTYLITPKKTDEDCGEIKEIGGKGDGGSFVDGKVIKITSELDVESKEKDSEEDEESYNSGDNTNELQTKQKCEGKVLEKYVSDDEVGQESQHATSDVVEIVKDCGSKKKNESDEKPRRKLEKEDEGDKTGGSIGDSTSEILEVVVNPKKAIPKPRRKHKTNVESSSASTEYQSDEGIESCKIKKNPKMNKEDKILASKVSYEREIKPVKPPRSRLQTTPKSKKIEKNSTSGVNDVEETSSGIKMSNEDLDRISYEKEIKPKPRKFAKQSADPEGISSENGYKYEKIFNVFVDRTDKLQLDSYVIHPVVKIHIVDARTGEYLKKSDKTRPVLFYYENNIIDYIGPIMTHPFNLQEKRLLYPNWEENVLINEDIDYLKNYENCIIFFEIMDFLSIDLIKSSNNKESLGWHKIAWAFVKLTPANLNKKLRLQLHRPHKPKPPKSPEFCEIFPWWSRRKFNKYPSTLHVTLAETAAPKLSSALRSKTPHQKESGKKIKEEKVETNKEEISWSGLERKLYRLPNKCARKLDGGDDGCFLLKFSNSGKELACCVLLDGINTIVIYSTESYEEIGRLPSHQGLIYSLIWSQDDTVLISASADCTVSIWNTTNYTFKQMLPHPSYVYTCDLNADSIATGCYDQYIRIWTVQPDEKYKLREELKGHKGYVTTLTFNKSGEIIYSGDSLGVIILWNFNGKSWNAEREIKILDIKGVVINQMVIYKREKRLLVNSRDDKIRSVDIRSGIVLQTYNGAANSRVNTKCAMSPCEMFVFSGSESRDLFAWSTDSGKVEKTWKPYEDDLAIHCVACHPKDDCIAFGHYGNSMPVLVFTHDRYDDGDGLVSDRISSARQRERSLDFKGILEKMDNIIGAKQ